MLNSRSDAPDPKKLCREAAVANDVKVFVPLLEANSNQLRLTDSNGWTLLHHACHNASLDVLAIILQHKPDIDAVDAKGDTGLHLAVRADHPEVIKLLIFHGAQGHIINSQKLAPLHLAVQLQKYNCLMALFDEGKLKADVEGEFKMTPLHLAAMLNDVKAAQILLDHGARMCSKCSLGLSALHYAAKNASKSVINLLLELAEAKGYTREFLLSSVDKHQHSPLHLAINSGNTEPVKVVLEAGAHIDCRQDDGSTSVHLVCSQPGTLDILTLMCNAQPERFNICLNTSDANGMMPLHRAALFDFKDVARYLIDQGSPLNPRDVNGKTPMLLAASRQSWGTVGVLYKAGAECSAKDYENSTFLHLAIKAGGDMSDLINCEGRCGLKSQMNEEDISGCTPLHYASKIGNLPSLMSLLALGARVTCTDKSKQSPLHFAAMYGRFQTCKRILKDPQGKFIINMSDVNGRSALHLAAQFGNVKIVALLMQSGALFNRDHGGNTPLHLASKQSYTQTIKLLLNVHPSLLNAENHDGNTSLHEAIMANKPKCVDLLLSMGAEIKENFENRTFLDIGIERSHYEATLAVINNTRWKEILMMPSHVHGSYLIGLVKHLPNICNAALDRCAESSEHDPISPQYSITYNFDLIRTDPESIPKKEELKEQDTLSENIYRSHMPMAALMSMVKYERVQCLSHPVCLEFVKMKWSTVGIWLHMLNLLLYALYLASLTGAIIFIGPLGGPTHTLSVNDTTTSSAMNPSTGKGLRITVLLVLLAFIGFHLLKEFAQVYQMKWRYFLEITNYMECFMYICTMLYAIFTLMNSTAEWVFSCGVIGLFFSWINLLLVLQRFEFFGIYVVMFKEILASLLQVLIVFSILLFAFGVTFYVLLRREVDQGYTTLPLATLTSVVMMVGDMNYMDTFLTPHIDGDPTTSRFSSMALIILCLFILLIPILLMNLLIGLAVGDIEGVQKNARLKRLAMQVELTADMEKKLPNFVIKRVNKHSITKFPNSPCAAITKWYEGLVQSSDKDINSSPENDELRSQLFQQKLRLKGLQADMKAQTELLKLVVAKMEIRTESSTLDEGSQDEDMDLAIILKQAASKSEYRWQAKSVKDTVVKSQVVSVWQKDSKQSTCQPMEDESQRSTSLTPVDAEHVETNF
ncbi:transient receptor potential cation channel subfamily A member 1-like isoform X2 [Watersipora subatra]|uniref:transient receptor potential cation channel subfamily A member 1-like isoform X2 n=1 Tax=Watersipora subatra TaxID=2589382 RepID=UPI00355BEBE4